MSRVPAARLFSIGFGLTRPSVHATTNNAASRADGIEVSRIQ
jgi:hypothetical protein